MVAVLKVRMAASPRSAARCAGKRAGSGSRPTQRRERVAACAARSLSVNVIEAGVRWVRQAGSKESAPSAASIRVTTDENSPLRPPNGRGEGSRGWGGPYISGSDTNPIRAPTVLNGSASVSAPAADAISESATYRIRIMSILSNMKGVAAKDQQMIREAETMMGPEPEEMGFIKNMFWGRIREDLVFPY